jgi:hypothetical protein
MYRTAFVDFDSITPLSEYQLKALSKQTRRPVWMLPRPGA